MDQVQGFHAVVSTCTASIREIQERLAELLDDLEYSDRDRFSVRLAVEEALVNALKHGNGRDVDRSIEVHCRVGSELIRIEIVDEGDGFDPSEVESSCEEGNILTPNGRGLDLMRRFMDRVEFNDTGNRVVLEKSRSDVEIAAV
mgnify:CR=1 FL=1